MDEITYSSYYYHLCMAQGLGMDWEFIFQSSGNQVRELCVKPTIC